MPYALSWGEAGHSSALLLQAARECLVGRQAACAVVISDTSVSRRHASIAVQPLPPESVLQPASRPRLVYQDTSKLGTVRGPSLQRPARLRAKREAKRIDSAECVSRPAE